MMACTRSVVGVLLLLLVSWSSIVAAQEDEGWGEEEQVADEWGDAGTGSDAGDTPDATADSDNADGEEVVVEPTGNEDTVTDEQAGSTEEPAADASVGDGDGDDATAPAAPVEESTGAEGEQTGEDNPPETQENAQDDVASDATVDQDPAAEPVVEQQETEVDVQAEPPAEPVATPVPEAPQEEAVVEEEEEWKDVTGETNLQTTPTGEEYFVLKNFDEVFVIEQDRARRYKDPGWKISESGEKHDTQVSFSLPVNLRKGVPGDYEITYQALDRDGVLLGKQRRTVRVTDIDECNVAPDHAWHHTCSENANCINTIGDYECVCKEGYRDHGSNGRECIDIDECAENTHECDIHADCFNTQGSYNCVCQPGWEGDGKTCTDIDECALGTHRCDAHARCENTEGNYTCECEEHYTGDGFECSPVNKCDEDKHDCDENAACIVTNAETGEFRCECNRGYTGDGRNCTDIDECATGTHKCVNADCVNLQGSYKCICHPGYEQGPNPETCVDIDECARRLHNCSQHARCDNTEGSYTCKCVWPYVGDGRKCIDNAAPNLTLAHAIGMDTPDVVIQQFTEFEEPGYEFWDNKDDELRMQVRVPKQLDGDALSCGEFIVEYRVTDTEGHSTHAERRVTVLPTNQCVLPVTSKYRHKCHKFAKCTPVTEPTCTYTCKCHEGYDGDGEDCKDITPPIINIPHPDPYLKSVCLVCDIPVNTTVSLGEKIKGVTAYDETPNGNVDLTSSVQLTWHKVGNNESFVVHNYTVTDAAGNTAWRVHGVVKVEEDLRQLIRDLKRQQELQEAATSRLSLFYWVLIVMAAIIAARVTTLVVAKAYLLYQVEQTEQPNHMQFSEAWSFWYRVLHPLESEREINRRVEQRFSFRD